MSPLNLIGKLPPVIMMKKISQEQQVTEEYGTEIVQGVRVTFFIITPTHVHAHSQCTGVEIPPSCQLAGSVDSFKGSVYASHPFSPAALGISPKWQGIFIKYCVFSAYFRSILTKM